MVKSSKQKMKGIKPAEFVAERAGAHTFARRCSIVQSPAVPVLAVPVYKFWLCQCS